MDGAGVGVGECVGFGLDELECGAGAELDRAGALLVLLVLGCGVEPAADVGVGVAVGMRTGDPVGRFEPEPRFVTLGAPTSAAALCAGELVDVPDPVPPFRGGTRPPLPPAVLGSTTR